jgi:hypothetical protein
MTFMAGIFNVIMNQGESVDEFEGCCGRHYSSSVTTYDLATEKAKSRANKLARWPVTGIPAFVHPSHVIPQHVTERRRTTINNPLYLDSHYIAIRNPTISQALFALHRKTVNTNG